MKKRKLLAFVMMMTMLVSNVTLTYAEETPSAETEQGQNIEETLIESTESEPQTTEASSENESEQEESESFEPIFYEIQEVLMHSDELQTSRNLIVKVVLNTTEGIENAVVLGVAEDKGAKVRYECTSINDTEIVFEIMYGDGEADHYTLKTLMIYTSSDELAYDLADYGDFSYAVYSADKGDQVPDISFYSDEKSKFTGINGDDGRFVIVLDPGHDPGCTDRGWTNGVWEPDLNWRMALSMKDELEKYEGVEVYINRTWDECPGVVDVDDDFRCLEMRVARGAALEADLVISLHNNAAGLGSIQTVASGAEVFISKYESYYLESQGLAEMVLDKLSELGLSKRGIFVKDYGDDGDFYDDGNSWDYYAINRHSTLMGIPSLLIEHAFMDNPSDLTFLRDDLKVDAIGRADAQAIVDYYELEYSDNNSYATGDMTIILSDNEYININISNVDASYEIQEICVAAWSDYNGKDDLTWYDAKKNNNGWTATVNIKNHNMDNGIYYFNLCYVDTEGEKHFVSSAETEVDIDQDLIEEYKVKEMYRLYNPNSGEHFYTENLTERDYLDEVGWNYEGIGWYAPETGNPVYRLYNPNAGDHHYTLSSGERDHLVSVGWNYEGIGWYSDVKKSVPLYRLYNPNAVAGSHHYTVSYSEAEYLDEVGWNYEGIGWYGVSQNK